jgi:curli biogenesis system outer membrane secretion channel CsgG
VRENGMNGRAWKIVFLAALLAGCVAGGAAVRTDSAAFLPDRGAKEVVPNVCKPLYETSATPVAIAPFSNNTSFDYAREVQVHVTGSSDRQAKGAAAAGAAPGGVGVVWGAEERRRFQQDTRMTQQEMNAKLSESLEDAVLDRIRGIPGIRVYARKELNKVFDEMKLQQSGMVDEATAVRLGKLAGAKLIVTGSFNNIALSYRSTQSIQQGSRDLGRRAADDRRGGDALLAALAGHVVAAAAEAVEGWTVETEVLVRVIDVETGEVTFSKSFKGREGLGKIPYPGFAEVVGGVKKAGNRELGDLRPALSRQFSARGYILQTKTSPDGSQHIALVNLGSKAGLTERTELSAYTFSEVEDPISGQKSCDPSRLPVVLRMTDQIQPDKAWVTIEGEPDCVKRVKMGQLVETRPF